MHAGSKARLDAVFAVLDHKAATGGNAASFRRQLKQIRRRFAVGDLRGGGGAARKEVGQARDLQ